MIFIKNIILSLVVTVFSVAVFNCLIHITVNNYFEWGVLAVIALVVVLIPMLIIDIIFYYRQLLTVKTKVIKIFRKK